MRETEFFKFIFFNIPGVLGAVALVLIAVTVFLGLRHRRRLTEDEQKLNENSKNQAIDAMDQASVREIGLSSAGLGGSSHKSKEETSRDQ